MPAPPRHRLVPHLAVLPRLALALIPIGIYTFLVCRAMRRFTVDLSDLGLEASILSGLLLSILLAFRNNAAYDRWWEARKLWGQLVNDARNFTIKLAAMANLPTADRSRAGQLFIAFAHALKNRLRGDVVLATVPGFENETHAVAHPPAHIAGQLFQEVVAWRAAGKIDGFDLLVIEPHVRSLMDVCGACERIRSTPVATSYRALLRIGIGVYIVVSPIYVARDFDYWAVPIELIVAFFMLGVEMVAHDVEEPFGHEGDDLALDAYCETIEQSVREIVH